MTNIHQIRRKLDKIKGRKEEIEKNLHSKESNLINLKSKYENLIKARWVISEVARLTQERFKERVEKLVTTAIRSVFSKDYRFVLEFERKRNTMECSPKIMHGSNELIPKEDSGGSLIDIISFAFRVVLWSLEKPRSRAFFILDEPGKHTSKKGDLLLRFGQVVREISHRLGFQVLMSTHAEELIEIGDRVWEVENNGTESIVKMIVGEEKPKKKVKRLRR